MSFLDEIIKRTTGEIAAAEKERSTDDLKRMIRDAPPLRSFAAALRGGFGLIAEIKKRSPSGGDMRAENFDAAPAAYAKSPVVKAVSVLTNSSFFGMGIDQLTRIKPLVRKPVLRKDFILKEYQVYEARAFGADALLLMANILDQARLKQLFELSRELELDVLFEVHEEREIAKIPGGAKIYGVNSRNFMATKGWHLAGATSPPAAATSANASDPTVELQTFEALFKHLPKGVIKVAESGVKPGKVTTVRDQGYDAVLVGTSLLKDPKGVEHALSEFEQALNPQQVSAVRTPAPA